jgi:hypothetical protein
MNSIQSKDTLGPNFQSVQAIWTQVDILESYLIQVVKFVVCLHEI